MFNTMHMNTLLTQELLHDIGKLIYKIIEEIIILTNKFNVSSPIIMQIKITFKIILNTLKAINVLVSLKQTLMDK